MLQLRSLLVIPGVCLALSACVAADDLAGGTDTSETLANTDSASETETDTSSETDTSGETDTGEPQQTGTEVGDIIADLVFFHGDGEPLALSSYYGQDPPALILFGTAIW